MKKIILALAKTGRPQQITMIGVGAGAARLTPYHPKVPADVIKKVEAFRKDIIAGKIKTPFMGEKLID